ncbi:hypothetical protein FEP16_05706 [Burkholderia multivorans]|nr:hypothetical protein [Burkholderia multivorans]MDR9201119.1 hypothetical protein [Burkholderia multivorans]MDR9206830.1 hypothetical protein [Burkholderia multivorans]MDR9218487.1 hypothetical protein [Burkholderia multivorans]MDR9247392.1 hypothetical protein [Burkholderia multivorans]
MPPHTPVIAPASTTMIGAAPVDAPTSQPMIVNAARPSASTVTNSVFIRATCRAIRDATVAATSVITRYCGCAIQPSG